MSALTTHDLRVSYQVGRTQISAVDGVSLAIPDGGTLGLVGESGCGKSSLARAIVGLAPVVSGSLVLDGVDHTPAKARHSASYRRRVQMVFQDPTASLNPRMSVGDLLDEALRMRPALERDRSGRRAELAGLLDRVGLSVKSVERYPFQFSGGQRQRIAIARALAVGPEVMVLDEVTSALDVSVQAVILNLLRELQKDLGLSYLFVTHDLSVARYISDNTAVMYLGRIVETGVAEEVFANPQHPYTQALIDSIPANRALGATAHHLTGDPPNPADPPAGCRFHNRCPVGPRVDPERTICLSQDPREGSQDKPHNAACHFAGSCSPIPTDEPTEASTPRAG